MASTFWVSDTHFGHANIIKYSGRPYENVEEMDRCLIENWNGRIQPEDVVYHLGDFAFYRDDKAQRILNRLNGKKHLIGGNHDKQSRRLSGWEWVKDYFETTVDGVKIIMCHYAMRVWNKSHHGSLMFYGHSHGTLPGDSQSLDVGVDCWNYAPVGLDEIRRRLRTLPERTPPDYHGVRDE